MVNALGVEVSKSACPCLTAPLVGKAYTGVIADVATILVSASTTRKQTPNACLFCAGYDSVRNIFMFFDITRRYDAALSIKGFGDNQSR